MACESIESPHPLTCPLISVFLFSSPRHLYAGKTDKEFVLFHFSDEKGCEATKKGESFSRKCQMASSFLQDTKDFFSKYRFFLKWFHRWTKKLQCFSMEGVDLFYSSFDSPTTLRGAWEGFFFVEFEKSHRFFGSQENWETILDLIVHSARKTHKLWGLFGTGKREGLW